MTRRSVRAGMLFLGPVLVVAVASYLIADLTFAKGGSKEGEAQSAPPPSIEELDRAAATLKAGYAEDEAKPDYYGPLGSFEIVQNPADTHPRLQCSDGAIATSDPDSPATIPPELDQPGVYEKGVCGDGRVVATAGQYGGYSYFADKPKVAASAPRERLELTKISGYEALFVNPPTGIGEYRVYIIKRAATKDSPGVLVSTSGNDRNQAEDFANRVVSQ